MSRDHNTPPAQCRWATLYVIGRLVRSLAPLAVGLSLPLSLPVVVYLTGLITQPNVTATAIAGQIGLVSHDSLVRMLGSLGWGLSCGACLVVRLVTALGSEGWLIIDDVLLPKPFAKLIAFCAWDHDHSSHRHTFGQRLVFIVWSNGALIIPLLFAFWQKDPTPKRRRRRRGKAKVGQRPRRRKRVRRPVAWCAWPRAHAFAPRMSWRGSWSGDSSGGA